MRLILIFVIFLSSCSLTRPEFSSEEIATTTISKKLTLRPDVFSFSRHDQVKLSHIALELKVKFKQKVLDGFAVLSYEVLQPNAKQLILDSRDLKIKRVEAMNDSKNNKLLWRMGQHINGLGTEVIIDLPSDLSPIKVYYETLPQASGLQWLEASQTNSGQQPYLFSQSQTIHARSWIPLQDTPSVRITYDASIQVKPGLTAVMSADNNNQEAVDGLHTFSMQQAIPSYLIAIAVGELEHNPISEHVTVYAAQSILAAASHEFAATEDMIRATEALYGPYRWGQYDLLVLPPSFPFGGMENPKLSHITPTIIAGDRSLDSLIAHELAHSWSGNLVTNADWQDAWLNEGFTSYLESRIIEAIYDRERMMMEATLVYEALLDEMATLTLDEQKLINPAEVSNPDDYFNGVAYDKGRFFLEWMEHQVGRAVFDDFLNQYFNHFAFQSITTTKFVTYLQKHLISKYPDKITTKQVEQWLYQSGMPAFFVPPTTDRFKTIDQQVQAWLDGEISSQQISTSTWTTQEWLHFLRALPENMSNQQIQALDQQFSLTDRTNSEVAHDWLLISIRNQYQPAYPRLIDYLTNIGRVKLIKPLYEAMMKEPALHNLSQQIYFKARPGYHNIAREQIDLIVGYGIVEE